MLSLSLGAGALTCHAMERRLTANTYEALLFGALSEKTKEGQTAAFQKAIALEPGRAQAYEELLHKVFLTAEQGSVSFDEMEDESLRCILYETDESGRTFESRLKERQAEYERLAYELGLAYYYYYEEEGNKAYAVKWLQIAAASGTLPVQQRERARRLGTIAGYYAQLGSVNKAGDASVSYGDYWRDLRELSAGNLVELDNVVTALRMYQEEASLIFTRAKELKDSGVTREELLGELSYIEEKLKTDVAGALPEEGEFEEMQGRLRILLQEAREQAETVYSVREEKEEKV